MLCPGAGLGIAGWMSWSAVGPCPGGCPGTRLDVARVNVQVWIGPFCGGITVADIALPAAIEVIALADAVVALDIKRRNIQISVDYQLCKNRLYMMLDLS